jgi:hypothetical protein
MKAAIDTLDSVIVKRPSYKQNLCLDKGYDFPEIEKETTKRRYIPHIRHKGEERFIELRYSTKRWVVEGFQGFNNSLIFILSSGATFGFSSSFGK